GRWIAVDNHSLNGVFVNGRRAGIVDIHDGQAINIGKPDGPRITFGVGQQQGAVGLLPPTESIPVIAPPGSPGPDGPPRPQPQTRLARGPVRPGDAGRVAAIPIQPGPPAKSNPRAHTASRGDLSQFVTRMVNVGGPQSGFAPPVAGAVWIGRS